MTDTRLMLASGALFDILDPAASDFTLGDIATGLGNTCRFGGQCNRFYSVAEHSIHVARIVPVDLSQAAMLHDASKAFVGDVIRPLKHLLLDYRRIEDAITAEIARRFLNGGAQQLTHPAIKAADNALAAIEAREFMPHAPGYWEGIGADPDTVDLAERLVRWRCPPPRETGSWWLKEWHRYCHLHAQRATGDERKAS